jgi:GNAT superfamily N-acetyltransferase
VTTSTHLDYEIRTYREADEARVLALLEAALGPGPAGVRSPAFFRWKHIDNPFGRSFMLVAEHEGRIIGLRAFLRWRFAAGDRILRAVQAVDTATHPDFQGMGVFARLTRRALEVLPDEADLVYNTPNEKSLPGYLKMGWGVVGDVPVSVRVRRPIRFARGFRSLRGEAAPSGSRPSVAAPSAAEVLGDGTWVPSLVAQASQSAQALGTARDAAFLRWRYADAAAFFDYRMVVQERGGRPAGLAVFRVRPRGSLWEAAVVDLLVRSGDAGTARSLLRHVIRSSGADHVTCSFPRRSLAGRAAARTGFLKAPVGTTLVVNMLGHSLEPDPTSLDSWALTLGDLEVF